MRNALVETSLQQAHTADLRERKGGGIRPRVDQTDRFRGDPPGLREPTERGESGEAPPERRKVGAQHPDGADGRQARRPPGCGLEISKRALLIASPRVQTAELKVRLILQRVVTDFDREGETDLTSFACAVMIVHRSQVLAGVGVGDAEEPTVAERFGERSELSNPRLEPDHVPTRVERPRCPEAQIEPLFARDAAGREALLRLDRLREHDRRFANGATGPSVSTGASEVQQRTIPDFRLPIVVSEHGGVSVDVFSVQRFEGLGDLSMEQAAPRAQERLASDLANAIVTKVEACSRFYEDVPAHQLFDRLDRVVHPDTGRALEEVEAEVTPDHRRGCGQLTRGHAEPIEASRNDLPHALGEWELALRVGVGTIAEAIEHLNDQERAALTRRPDAVVETRERRLIAATAELRDKLFRLVSIEGSQRDLERRVVAIEVVENSSERRRVREVFRTRREHEEHRPRAVQSPGEKRK
jgi:hypothetical protein